MDTPLTPGPSLSMEPLTKPSLSQVFRSVNSGSKPGRDPFSLVSGWMEGFFEFPTVLYPYSPLFMLHHNVHDPILSPTCGSRFSSPLPTSSVEPSSRV